MKYFSLKMLTLGSLALAGSAMADNDPVTKALNGLQLNPIMAQAFANANTSITIRNHPFVVLAPATCNVNTCSVVLDYMNNDPKSFIVLHEKVEGDATLIKAKLITIFPQQLYQLTYLNPAIKHVALTVTDIHRIYR